MDSLKDKCNSPCTYQTLHPGLMVCLTKHRGSIIHMYISNPVPWVNGLSNGAQWFFSTYVDIKPEHPGLMVCLTKHRGSNIHKYISNEYSKEYIQAAHRLYKLQFFFKAKQNYQTNIITIKRIYLQTDIIWWSSITDNFSEDYNEKTKICQKQFRVTRI